MRHDPGPAFRALHQPGSPFILANAWDGGSAKVLAALGAKAIGTTSSGYAFTKGLPDGAHISLDDALGHAADLVAATPLPVSGDLENGYAEAPDGVAQTIRLAEEAGLAGASIEDIALPDAAAYDFDLALERIKAAVSAARSLKRDFVLVARADGLMTGAYDLDEALRRVTAFADAGADCVYVPLLPDLETVARLCGLTGKPVNVLAPGPMSKFSSTEIANAGVARISLGSALARVTHAALIDASKPVIGGDFSSLSAAVPGRDVDALLERGS